MLVVGGWVVLVVGASVVLVVGASVVVVVVGQTVVVVVGQTVVVVVGQAVVVVVGQAVVVVVHPSASEAVSAMLVADSARPATRHRPSTSAILLRVLIRPSSSSNRARPRSVRP